MIFKNRVTLVLILGFIFAVAVAYVTRTKTHESDNTSLTIGNNKDVSGRGSFAKDVTELEEYWRHIHLGTDFYKAGKFNLAEQEARIAIEKSRSDGDVWVARSLLKRIYENQGRTDLVLNEIDWMIRNNNRPDVLTKLYREREIPVH